MNLINIELSSVPFNHDYWCDVFVEYAEHEDGTPLTDEELENIDSDIIYEEIIQQL